MVSRWKPEKKDTDGSEYETIFLAFGCEHKNRELSQQECVVRGIQHFGMCWHVYECERCHHISAQDSSG